MKQRPIELTIDHLVLHGANAADRDRLLAAIESELSRMLAEEGLPSPYAHGGIVDRLHAGPVNLDPGASVETTGQRVAGAVYEGLRR